MSEDTDDEVDFFQDYGPSIQKYLKDNNIDDLRKFIIKKIEDTKLSLISLVTIASINSETSSMVKRILNSFQVNELELANHIAREIIFDIEKYVEHHLEKYQKYTLNDPSTTSRHVESSRFFNLISLLKDVSILGRKLLESALQFNVQKSPQKVDAISLSDSDSLACTKSLSGQSGGKSARDEDATSEDLLAALIESSSTDDFLVLSSSLDSITTKDMIVAALIYIKCHDCFTLSHDIQGVVMVLRRTKFMVLNILAPKNQMELITKLLTSIGRYSEMNYVFDLFRDRNQFEILLSKGVEKTPELRIALFNYVKKNPEFYPLVTLNFSMFREIAESLEASATKRLNKLILSKRTVTGKTIPITSGVVAPVASLESLTSSLSTTKISTLAGSSLQSSTIVSNAHTPSFLAGSANLSSTSTKQQEDSDQSVVAASDPKSRLYSEEGLNLCLIELVDASDCYAKAGCYKRSNQFERQAKLVALQLALLPTGINVLAVAQSELNDLIVSLKFFPDAYTVAEAYDYHLAWRQALFKNVILDGQYAYLQGFCKKCDLSTVLIEELVLLYKKYVNSHQLSQEDSSRLAKAMKTLLTKLADVELKCKIYTQLNFDDAKEELLKDPAIEAHLRDLKLA